MKISHILRIGFIVMLSTLVTACSNLALTALNTPSYLFSSHEVHKNIAYGALDHQKLDLYLPDSNAPLKKQMVVFIYGGSWTSGSKANYYFVADALTSAGYAVAIPDYIKFPDDVFPAFVNDIALSIAWLEQHAEEYLPVESLVLMGHSAGAHTGALLITDSQYLNQHNVPENTISAFIGLAGPYNFRPKEKKYRDIFNNLEDFAQMRPTHFVSGKEPPVLLLHGAEDTTVLSINTTAFEQRLEENGSTVNTKYYATLGHVNIALGLSRTLDRKDVVLKDILSFLQNQGS